MHCFKNGFRRDASNVRRNFIALDPDIIDEIDKGKLNKFKVFLFKILEYVSEDQHDLDECDSNITYILNNKWNELMNSKNGNKTYRIRAAKNEVEMEAGMF